MRRPFTFMALAGLASLSACGPQVYAPSLAPRAVEKQPIELPAEASEPETPADSGLAARLAPLVASARAGDQAFVREHGEAEALVAKGAGTERGGEAWIVAQQALTALDTARGPVRDAAAAIEAIRSEPAYAGSGSRATIDAAAKTIEALDDAESTAVSALTAKLGG